MHNQANQINVGKNIFDQALQNIGKTTYSAYERQSVIEQIEQISIRNLLVNPQIVVTPQHLFKITAWVFLNNQKPPVNIYFLLQQDGTRSFLTKPSPQWKFIQKYENYSEPELTSMYHKNNKLDGIIDKLKTEFLLNYPYIPNTIIKDPAKQELEKKIKVYTDKMEEDWNNLKSIGKELSEEYQQCQDQRAKLKQVNSYLSDLNQVLGDEIKCMKQFEIDHSSQEVNEENILKILSLDQADDQICNLYADILGIRDTYKYAQNRIKTSSNVSLEWVCSIVKQLAEQEFNDIQLLKKCKGSLERL